MERKDRTGETKKNNAGFTMTIETYRHANDIDVRFEDGSLVSHKKYSHFNDGSLQHPSQSIADGLKKHMKHKRNQYENQYLGQSQKMNCGNTCTIIAYESSKHITVQFKDTNSIVHSDLKRFKEKTIQDPNRENTQLLQNRKKRMQETVVAECGMDMSIQNYHRNNHIDIIFQDGTEVKNRAYTDFKSGHIIHPLYPAQKGSLYERTTKIKHVKRKTIAYVTDRPNYYCICTLCGKSDIWDFEEIEKHNQLHEGEEHD